MTRALILAYGNPLRGDDGIAWRAAEALQSALRVSARILCTQQLAPELAEAAADAEIVIFLDAAADGKEGEVTCRAISAQSAPVRFSHHLAPEQILALSGQLYSAAPRGFLITAHARSFKHGDTLSPAAQKMIPRILEQVCALLKKIAA